MTEAMGIGGLRERSLSPCDRVNAGQNLLNARQPVPIGVC